MQTPAKDEPVHDVVVVGAGPAGLGIAATLTHLDVRATVVDRHGIGASFRRWPEGMRLITPSFPGNQFGAVDLNAITPDTSPALSLAEEHPTGDAYADYLEMVADLYDLDVRGGVEVTDVSPLAEDRDGDVLAVYATGGAPMRARTVVWAAGELQYPTSGGFPGADHAVPTVRVRTWDDHPGGEVVIVGGYESGIDAAVNLVERGRRVTVLDRGAPWETVDADPSLTLSPYTHGRLRRAHDTGHLDLIGRTTVTEITHVAGHGYRVHTSDADRCFVSEGPPLLATGFDGSLTVVSGRFAFDDLGRVELTEVGDESTLVPGLFLAGPMLAHREAIFCFVYKFRQRFAVVAGGIAARLGIDPAPLKMLREHGFYLDDLSCCDDACVC